jgi:hypothetical protein
MKEKIMNKTAKLVKDVSENFKGNAALYKLSTPAVYKGYDNEDPQKFSYVVVSTSNVPFSGPETYIFPANESGDVVSWGELDGSMRGSYTHAEVLREAGYEVAQ